MACPVADATITSPFDSVVEAVVCSVCVPDKPPLCSMDTSSEVRLAAKLDVSPGGEAVGSVEGAESVAVAITELSLDCDAAMASGRAVWTAYHVDKRCVVPLSPAPAYVMTK